MPSTPFLALGRHPSEHSIFQLEPKVCDNIDANQHLSILETRNGNEKCVSVIGLDRGRGSDNPFNPIDVLLADCDLYDMCPSDGEFIAQDADGQVCFPGEGGHPAAGRYPDDHPYLGGKLYSETMPRWACFTFSDPGVEGMIFEFEVGESATNNFGRNFLFSVESQPHCAFMPPPSSPPPAPPPPPPPRPPPSPPPLIIQKDPHLYFADGGRADFRGKHGQLYAFFSAPGLAVNLKTEEATFQLKRNRLTVHGSFITEVHVAAQVGTREAPMWANFSYWASELHENNYGWQNVNGTCDGFYIQLGRGGYKRCGALDIQVEGARTATLLLRPPTRHTPLHPLRRSRW